MIFVYRPAASQSAKALALAVDGVRIRREENLRRRVKATDKVVMWGAYLPNIQGMVLNNTPLTNKFEDAVRLKTAGVRTVEVSRTRPAPPAPPAPPIDPLIALWEDAQDTAEAFAAMVMTRNIVAQQGITELITKLTNTRNAMQRPAPVAPPMQANTGEWLARKFDHVGGNDLLNPNTVADYYSKKENFVREYRVHSFFGRSIRAGQKIPRTLQSETPFNGNPHPWIRSFAGGWQISYADGMLGDRAQRIRDAAHTAVRALGLNFGAVDIGELADGTLVVLEVNRAPGVEGGTTEAYARTIRRWIAGEWTPEGNA